MKLCEPRLGELDLERTIQAYALCMADQDYGQENRVLLHEHLRNLLGFDVTIFDDMDGCTITFEAHIYEKLLREEINRLKKKQSKTGD